MIETYGDDFPVLAGACSDVELAADTVLVVEGARLDVASHHHIETRVGRLRRVGHIKVVPANAQLVLRVDATLGSDLLQQHAAAEIDFLLFAC